MILSDGDIGYDSRQEKTYILPFRTGICFVTRQMPVFLFHRKYVPVKQKNALLFQFCKEKYLTNDLVSHIIILGKGKTLYMR